MFSFELQITITSLTRVTPTTATCIDNFLIGPHIENYTVNNLNLQLSDHFTQNVLGQLAKTKNNITPKTYTTAEKLVQKIF